MAEDDDIDEGPSFQYPYATAPDIIRAHQKDAYFQGLLLEHVSTIVRKLYGARFLHTYSTEARAFADGLYLGLTTFLGNRTLGEEYCDIVQVEDDGSTRLPDIRLRSAYIVTSILVPYGIHRMLPAFRRRIRAKLESILQRKEVARQKAPRTTKQTPTSRMTTAQQYILDNLDTLTSPAPIYALSLATFYFTGAYYHLSKRLVGLRYIFTRELPQSSQRVGYEVLGVLLVLQLAVQGYMHVHDTLQPEAEATRSDYTLAASPAGGSASVGAGVELSLDPNAYSSNNAVLIESATPHPGGPQQQRIAKVTHTPLTAGGEPRFNLADDGTMRWLGNRQTRKCTLCLEPMKDPSATTCGHVFCWACICDWCREKPECPLCRQAVGISHILPLRG